MAPKTKEQYIRQILRRIRVTDGVKRRIRADLLADIAAKQDAGQTLAQIQAEMGSPDRAAAEFNAAYDGTPARRWYVWQQAAKAAAPVLLVLAVLCLAASPAVRMALFGGSVGIIGGADGPTSIYVTAGPQSPVGSFLALYGLPLALLALAVLCLAAWLLIRRIR